MEHDKKDLPRIEEELQQTETEINKLQKIVEDYDLKQKKCNEELEKAKNLERKYQLVFIIFSFIISFIN